MFDKLISLLEKLKDDEYGTWIVDHEHKGTPEDPIHFPFPVYSDVVEEFIDTIYEFCENHPEYNLTSYYDLLKDRGIENVDDADIDLLDA